jgi:hypothetical protein
MISMGETSKYEEVNCAEGWIGMLIDEEVDDGVIA